MKRCRGKNLKIFPRKCSLSPVFEKCHFPWKKPPFCFSDVFHRKTPTPTCLRRTERENRGFRTLNDAVLRASLIPTSRLLCIITCHTSSLFYVTACHMTRCIVKTAAPILFRAVVSSCKASQIFFHILILRKASIMSPMCSGCGGRAFEPHCSAPRERHDESRVFLFSQIFHIPTWQVGNIVLQCLLIR